MPIILVVNSKPTISFIFFPFNYVSYTNYLLLIIIIILTTSNEQKRSTKLDLVVQHHNFTATYQMLPGEGPQRE